MLRTVLMLAGVALVGTPQPAHAANKIKVMLLDGQNNHNWKATTPVMKSIFKKAGLFTVEVVTSPPRGGDMSAFKPNFAAFDVVVSNYNGAPWPRVTQQAFEAFIKNGGGLVVVHAANNAFGAWPAYNEMIGVGGWGGRNEKSGPYIRLRDGKFVHDTSPGRSGSHGAQHAFELITRTPRHPITFGLPARWTHAKDELYDRLRGPAKNVTVLATAFASPDKGGTGEHEPLLMTIDYGKGRCFHTALGHSADSMRDSVGFQATLVRGTEWAATGAVTQKAPSSFDAETDGWVSLFDGKSLRGWTRKNGTAKYRVEAGTVLGTTHDGSPNSFLCTDKNYRDFELVFEVKVDDALNSGVQIRSVSEPNIKKGRVHGPQVEIATNGTAGFVYGEALGTGWLSKDRSDADAKAAFKKGAWNKYRVRAVGTAIKTWVNGTPVADLTDTDSKMPTGFIGLQVHGIGRGTGPYRVQWRNIYLKDLSGTH